MRSHGEIHRLDPSNGEAAASQLSVDEVYPRRATTGFQLSPDGRQLAFVLQHDLHTEETSRAGRTTVSATAVADLCLLPSDGGYPRTFTGSGDVRGPSIWSPEGHRFVLERGGEVVVVPAAGGVAQTVYKGKLYHPPLALGDVSLGSPRWSPSGDSILFAVREPPSTILRLVSADGHRQRDLLSVEGYIIGWDWSPDGQRVLVVARGEDGWVGDVRLVNVATGELHVLWGEENYEYLKPAAMWAADGEQIVFRSNRSGWAKLWVASSSGGKVTPVTSGAWDDYAFRLSPDGMSLVYASRAEQNGGSGDDLWMTALSGGQPRRLTRQPGINVPLAWSSDDRLFFWHSSPTEPGDLWVISAKGDEGLMRLTWTAPLELAPKLRAPEEVVIPGAGGSRIPALIYRPATYRAGHRYPAIVWIRGGPTLVGRYDFSPFYNWLANQGYVVVTPNYRGSVGYGIEHMAAVAGSGLGKNDLEDVLAAGRYARTLPDVDLTRGVGVGGRSWGGYLALMAVTQAPDDFSCAVAGAAISDWRIQQAQTEVRYYDRWLMGGWVYEQAQRCHERSPVHFVDRITVPLLIQHGTEDRDVPFAQAEHFVARARQAGVAVEYVAYPAEGHSNEMVTNQQDALDRIRVFFRRNLQPWNLRDNPCGDQVQT